MVDTVKESLTIGQLHQVVTDIQSGKKDITYYPELGHARMVVENYVVDNSVFPPVVNRLADRELIIEESLFKDVTTNYKKALIAAEAAWKAATQLKADCLALEEVYQAKLDAVVPKTLE